MRVPRLHRPRLTRARTAWVVFLVAGTLAVAGTLRLVGGPGDEASLSGEQTPSGNATGVPTPAPTGEPTDGPTDGPFPSDPTVPTFFTMSSFNVLGAGHTSPQGNKKGWAPGEKRMKWAIQLLQSHDVDVAGLQEFEMPQYRVFKSELGSTWGAYPGASLGKVAVRNSIIWRLADWELVTPGWMKIPYFHGNEIRIPVVLLRNLHNGSQAWFLNSHNPANARGPAQKWRNIAAARQIAKVNSLRASTGLPVFLTGDMNERDTYFCKVTAATDLRAANGGANDGSGCRVPRPTIIDWIFGSADTWFTSYLTDRSKLVRKTTDHRMVVAKAIMPPALEVNACGKLTLC
jgi:hypothetical protein